MFNLSTLVQNLAALYQSVLDGLRDSDLPVRVEAALALQPMIRHESGMLLRPPLWKFTNIKFYPNLLIFFDLVDLTVRNAMIPSLPFIMQG